MGAEASPRKRAQVQQRNRPLIWLPYLLDTNVIIDAINAKKNRNQFLVDLTERQGHTLAACPINVAEVFAGMRTKEMQRTTDLLRSLELFPITFPVAALAGILKRNYSKKGITLGLTDALSRPWQSTTRSL